MAIAAVVAIILAAAFLFRAGGTIESRLVLGGMVSSIVRCRLVLLNARLGRLAVARRHWSELERTCDRPDAEMAARMRDARSALEAAEALEPIRAGQVRSTGGDRSGSMARPYASSGPVRRTVG